MSRDKFFFLLLFFILLKISTDEGSLNSAGSHNGKVIKVCNFIYLFSFLFCSLPNFEISSLHFSAITWTAKNKLSDKLLILMQDTTFHSLVWVPKRDSNLQMGSLLSKSKKMRKFDFISQFFLSFFLFPFSFFLFLFLFSSLLFFSFLFDHFDSYINSFREILNAVFAQRSPTISRQWDHIFIQSTLSKEIQMKPPTVSRSKSMISLLLKSSNFFFVLNFFS